MSLALPFFIALACVGFLLGQMVFHAWGLQYTLNGRLLNLLNGGPSSKTIEYNLQESIQQLWNLGKKEKAWDMYVDAIILFTMSAIVPHLKLFLTICIWYWPNISHQRRLQRFLALDNVGRWNHYDIIVVVYFVAICKLAMIVAEGTIAETDMDLYTYTCPGAYYYCFSVVLSQMIGHWLVHEIRAIILLAHEKGEGLTPRELTSSRPPTSQLNSPRTLIIPPNREWCIREEMTVHYGTTATYGFPIILTLNVILYIVAIAGIAFVVEFKIPLVDLADEHYSMLGSIFDVMKDIPPKESDKHGQRFIGFLVLVFILFAPSIRLITQGVLWYMPMSTKWHAVAETVHEVSMLWSCLDVSLFAGLLVVAETKPITSSLFTCPEQLGKDCFYIAVHPGPSFITAFFSVFVSYALNMFMNAVINKSKEQVNSSSVHKAIVRSPSSGGHFNSHQKYEVEVMN